MKKELYRILQENKGNRELTVLSLIDGEYAGEKVLLSGESILAVDGAENMEDSFIVRNLESLIPVNASGLKEIDGNRIYCEKIGDEQKLVICGGGHVSAAVLRMGKMLGFRVTVLDDRLSFADEARRLGADEVIYDDFVHALSGIKGGRDTYFVVVTRGHRWDAECLRVILEKDYAYAGMIGSKKRVILLKQSLEEEGYSKEKLDGLHSPIGLSIGAESPEEIAVSILGEIIQEKNMKKRSAGYGDRMLCILDGEKEPDASFALATIVSRRGSAPREAGTKMIVFPDGRIVGTIGGGCMENEIIRSASRLLNYGKCEHKLVTVDMSGNGDDEGMVCGGQIEVMLETISA